MDSEKSVTPQGAVPAWLEVEDGRQRLYVRTRYATWDDLTRARHTAIQDLARAQQRGWWRAARQARELREWLGVLMETLAPLMRDDPALTLFEACTRLDVPSLKRVREL